MARVTLAFDGLRTLAEMQEALHVIETAGLPFDSVAERVATGLSGAAFSVACGLDVLGIDDEPDEED